MAKKKRNRNLDDSSEQENPLLDGRIIPYGEIKEGYPDAFKWPCNANDLEGKYRAIDEAIESGLL